MPDPMPSCFRGITAGAPPASTAAGPSLTTSIFDTDLGLAYLTWSRTLLGLSLRAFLRLSPSSGDDDEDDEQLLHFRIRPWIFWKRRGTRRLNLKSAGLRALAVDVAWDLSRARFPSAGGPEPSSGFFVAVAVDGEMALVAGDLVEEAHRKMKAGRRIPESVLVSRKEHVVLKGDAGAGGRRFYRSAVRVSGKEREIGIEIGGKEKEPAGMSIAIGGMKVLQIRRIRWKFRGSERVEIDGGGRIQISWDLHSWLFPSKDYAPPHSFPGAVGTGQAVFFFRFESYVAEKVDERASAENAKVVSAAGGGLYRELLSRYLGRNRNWSESSSGGGGSERRKGRKKNLLKACSSSSSSSASSSAASSSVMEWASPEEAELRVFDGFTLVVYAWKS